MSKKSPLKNFNFDDYHQMLEDVVQDQVHVVHVFDRDYPKGGFTVAWQRAASHKNSRMVNLSVAYCNPNDTFIRKIGFYNAVNNLYNGKYISLPIGDPNSEIIVNRLVSVLGYIM